MASSVSRQILGWHFVTPRPDGGRGLTKQMNNRRLAGVPHGVGSTQASRIRAAILSGKPLPNEGWRELVVNVRSTVTTSVRVPTTSTSTSDNLVSTRFIRFMRPKIISYSLSGMRQNITLIPTFDGIDVTAYCSNLTTDQTGKVIGTFTIPGGTFNTGERELLFEDADKTTSARTTYTAKGILNIRQRTVTTIRSFRWETRSSTNINQVKTWADPIAESFLISNNHTGIFLTSFDFFFYSKDSNLPVSIQLVEMSNGYPTQKSIPLSDVMLYPSSVNTSTDGYTPTTFTFSTPIFLEDGHEYAVVLHSDSNNYQVWYARQGNPSLNPTDTLTNRNGPGISKQPFLGVMFKSQNSSTWTSDQMADIKFVAKRAQFNTAVGEYFIELETLAQATNITSLLLNIHNVVVKGTSIDFAYSFDQVSWTPVNNLEELTQEAVRTLSAGTPSSMYVRMRLNTDSPFISPMIDLNRMSISTSMNQVDANNVGATYISNQVQLSDPALDLRVLLDAAKPGGSTVDVYFSTQTPQVPRSVTNVSGYTDPVVYTGLVGKNVYVYHRELTTGSLTEVGGFSPTKIDSVNTFLKSISDIAIFDDPINITTYVNTDKVFYTTVSGLTVALDWAAGSHAAGTYVFHLSKLWVSNVTTTATPATNITDWTEIPVIATNSIVTTNTEIIWRPMKLKITPTAGIDLGTMYEYEYEPDSIIEEAFDRFAIKIVLSTTNAAQPPVCRKLRAIAAT